jgi:arylsulfatase A-like enzyme
MKLKKHTGNSFLKKAAVGIGCLLLFPALILKAAPAEKPNIILVVGDNLGYGDFGFSGNKKVKTPHIDKFAREGIQFDRFYTNPMCAPTRASIMTGRYPYRTGIIHTSRGGAKMHGDEITVAEYLNDAGYATGLFGKWHLGDNYPMRPQDQGFSETLWFKSGRIGQVPDYPNTYFNPMLYQNGEKVQTDGYCSDVFTDATIEFIEKQTTSKKPFFVYLPYNAAHRANRDVVGELVDEKYSDPYKKMGCSDETADVYGMATNIDENFGRLIEKLDELDLRNNTILIFTTEDGPGQEYNAGLRSGEGDELSGCDAGAVYDGDIRVPFIIRWPDRLKAGRRIEQIASHIDILPTLLDAAGQKMPEQPVIDGKSLLPLLDGEEQSWKDRMLFVQCHRGLDPQRYQNCAVITQDFKMVGYPNTFNERYLQISLLNPYLELYDLQNDPGETSNIAEKQPETLRFLKMAYDRWFDDVKSTRNFEPGLIHIGSGFENPTHLCRYQDASYYNEEPTGWPVVVEEGGKYEIEINRAAPEGKGSLFLKIDDEQVSVPLNEGENKAVFFLPKGKFKLNIWFQEEGLLFHKPRSIEDPVGDVFVKRI